MQKSTTQPAQNNNNTTDAPEAEYWINVRLADDLGKVPVTGLPIGEGQVPMVKNPSRKQVANYEVFSKLLIEAAEEAGLEAGDKLTLDDIQNLFVFELRRVGETTPTVDASKKTIKFSAAAAE